MAVKREVVDLGTRSLSYSPRDIIIAGGYRNKKQFHYEAELVAEIEYRWKVRVMGKTYTQRMYAYTYTYPRTTYQYGTVNTYATGPGDRFFDDTLNEPLGGPKEMLGV